MSWQAIVAAVLGCFLSCPLLLNGQMTPSAPGSISSASAEPHYPEQAYLSSARYTNGFFGFSFELPADAHLEPVSQPVAADGGPGAGAWFPASRRRRTNTTVELGRSSPRRCSGYDRRLSATVAGGS